MRFRIERSGLVAMRAIRAEAQGICSGSPVVLQRQAAYGKRNVQLRCGCSVFSVRFSVNRRSGRSSDGIRHRSAPSDVQLAPRRGRFFPNCSHFSMAARTAIWHGSKRVLKTVVDAVARLTRRADALPLAGCVFMRFIHCPEISWRDSPTLIVADRG